MATKVARLGYLSSRLHRWLLSPQVPDSYPARFTASAYREGLHTKVRAGASAKLHIFLALLS